MPDLDEWDSTHPTFAPIMPSDRTEAKEFVRALHQTLFCDPWMRCFSEASGKDSTGGALLKLVLPVLSVADSAPPSEGHANAELLTPALRVLRGIVALCSHTPGLHGATLKDAQYLVPEAKSSQLVREIPRFGALLVNIVKSNPVWEERMKEYIVHAGAEAAHGAVIRNLIQQAEVLSKRAGALASSGEYDAEAQLEPEKLSLLALYMDQVPNFTATLRPRAAEGLEELLISFMVADWKLHARSLKFVSACLKPYCEALRMMTSQTARALLQDMTERLQEIQFADAMANLELRVTQFKASSALPGVPDLLHAFKQAESVDSIGQELLVKLEECITLIRFCLTIDASMPSGAPELRQLKEFWTLVLGSKHVRGLQAQAEIRSMCTHFLQLLNALLQLLDTYTALTDLTNNHGSADQLLKANEAYFQAWSSMQKALAKATPPDIHGSDFTRTKEELTEYSDFAHKPRVAQAVADMLNSVLETATRATHTLKQVAGGAAGGAVWHAECNDPDTILETFENTLGKADVKQISAARASTTQASSRIVASFFVQAGCCCVAASAVCSCQLRWLPLRSSSAAALAAAGTCS